MVEAVSVAGQVEGGQSGLVNLLGGPAGDVGTTVEQYFKEPDHAGVMDLDAGDLGRAVL